VKPNSIITSIADNEGVSYMERKNEITLYGNYKDEILRITEDGFYVRGVKVPQDEREAESVYKTFHQWLTWATLTRNY
jgi:hypothetical protein